MTKQFGMRLTQEEATALEKRSTELNRHFPEVQMTPSKLFNSISKANLSKYIERQERVGYDHLLNMTKAKDERLINLLQLLEIKAYDTQVLTGEAFKTSLGMNYALEMNDITRAILAIGTDNNDELLEIAAATTCEQLLNILTKEGE